MLDIQDSVSTVSKETNVQKLKDFEILESEVVRPPVGENHAELQLRPDLEDVSIRTGQAGLGTVGADRQSQVICVVPFPRGLGLREARGVSLRDYNVWFEHLFAAFGNEFEKVWL